MPTTRPRYTVTDTGDVAQMLDLAQRAWPDVRERKELLLRLAGAGCDRVAQRLAEEDTQGRRERQRAAFARAGELVDTELLLSDAAWR